MLRYALALSAASAVAANSKVTLRRQDGELGQRPALGWNGWNQGGCDSATAQTALNTAQAFIDLGMKDVGYTYINIDDCWSLMDRDENGNLVPDPEKFPDGMAALADQIHDMGFKLGLYGDAGTKTCAGYPGSQGHEQQDAELLASWGVDYWKHDNCYTPCEQGDDVHTCPADQQRHSQEWYQLMGDAISGLDYPILFSLCNWGWHEVWTWGNEVHGQSWRMSTDNWGGWEDVVRIANKAVPISEYSAPGGFNDLDMMIIGNGALTAAQDRTHFAIWAIAKSPILHGTDMTNLSPEQIELITNKGLIDINQDSLGVAATAFTPDGASGPGNGELHPYWSGPLSDGTVVALVASGGAGTVSVDLGDVPELEAGEYSWVELLSGEEGSGSSLSADLEEHDIAVFKITHD